MAAADQKRRREPPLFGISQRQWPCNLQAEQALLGAIFANNKAYHRVSSFLAPEHFMDAIHGRIFAECAKLILAGRLADAVSLQPVLEASGVLDEVGGVGYLAELLTAMVGIINAAEYGRVIRETWLRRELITAGEAAVNRGFDDETDAEDQLALAADRLLELSSGAADSLEVSAADAARTALSQAEAAARGDADAGLRSGFVPFDDLVGALRPQWFYILGGRPGMGKSTLAAQVAVGVARQLLREEDAAPPFSGAGGDVVFFSLEMPVEQLGGWMQCHIARVSNDVLEGRPMTGPEAEALIRAGAELDRLPIRLVDAVGMTGPGIGLRVSAMNARRRVRLVLVDNVQKVVSSRVSARRDDSDIAATQKTSSALKDLARRLKCPVLALWHLSRDVDKRDDPRPRLSDLMYGGEQDADVAAFLFRPERYLKKRPPDKLLKETEEAHAKRVEEWHKQWDAARDRAEIIVAKRRQGAEGVKVVRFEGATLTFSEIGAAASSDQFDMDEWEQQYG